MSKTEVVNNPLSILLISVSSPEHYALWNALSIETLAGDIKGTFGNKVQVRINRIRQNTDIDVVIENLDPATGIIGISVELGSLLLIKVLVERLKTHLKSQNFKPTIVFGNTIPTYQPDLFFDIWPSAIVVRGEGEFSFRGIVNHLLNNKRLDEIPSLVFRKDGVKVSTRFTPPDLTLLKHSPTLDTINEVLSCNGSALMETSRGCPWSRCSYCSIASFRNGRKWESLPLERIRENLIKLIDAGVQEIEFTDADFMGGRSIEHTERIQQLSKIIRDVSLFYNKQISFRVFLTPQILYRPEDEEGNIRIKKALESLKAAGMSKVYLGVESGCQSQINRYKKGSKLSAHSHVINMLRKEIGCEIDFGFLLFDPNLTLKEMSSDIKFFKDQDLLRGNQWPFRPIRVVHDTPLHKTLLEAGQLGEFDENLLNYSYSFSDKKVQIIADIVDNLSAETREIFYAVKTISKLQISPGKQTKAAICALDIVKENALIYLDLMEALEKQIKKKIPDIEPYKQLARKHIDNLIKKTKHEVEKGLLIEHADFLLQRIKEYQELKQ
ncbi:MAG: hypothetical protein A2W99_00100 [Bacteroidetes bacterium GWF2_33_16]|nr:MAG: hypothetical protein A2X00_02805 [Bacteroidetes bacterium GWE2_32_14]OFY08676.1 MAG: hypothetical protein A2W99_00100 [Bacteroidetes bacterium GWF2_33_16]